jgi:hypothetical protein
VLLCHSMWDALAVLIIRMYPRSCFSYQLVHGHNIFCNTHFAWNWNARGPRRYPICLIALGGVLKGPILQMALNYSLSDATFISYSLMFCGCIINGLYVMCQKYIEINVKTDIPIAPTDQLSTIKSP